MLVFVKHSWHTGIFSACICVFILVVSIFGNSLLLTLLILLQSLMNFGQKAKIEDYYLKRNSCWDCLVLGDLYEQCSRVN